MKPIILGLDYETFYDSKGKYSLRVMGNEEYILDKRFQCHGCAVSVDGAPAKWCDPAQLKNYFATLDWRRVVVVSHNALFDAAITLWRYGHQAGGYVDTMGIAHCFIRPYMGRSSLEACSIHEGWAGKGDALKEVNGKRTEEIKQYQGLYERLAEMSCHDADKSIWLWQKYYPQISTVERVRMDWAVRSSIRGRLRIDMAKMHTAYVNVVNERNKLLEEAGIDAVTARSRPKFAAYLESLGIEVDYKKGKREAEIPCLAKNEPFVAKLLASDNAHHVALMRARLAFASTIEVTRAERLLKMGRATGGKMLFPVVWHAAHTGRPGGTDGVNPLNFTRSSPIRAAIVVPIQHALLDADASQIEARICAWMAGCERLVDAFADRDRDVYCEVATTVFNKEVTPDMEMERQVGKVTALSAQYGVGWMKTMKRLQAIGIVIDEPQARRYIGAYREGYPEILGNGDEFINLLKDCVSDKVEIEWKGCLLTPRGIRLPAEKRWLRYDQMCIKDRQIAYYSHRYKNWKTLFHGAINENLCQAMTNDHVGAVQAKHISKCVGMVYDSIILLEHVDKIEPLKHIVVKQLSTPSPWMVKVSELPLPLAAKAVIKEHW